MVEEKVTLEKVRGDVLPVDELIRQAIPTADGQNHHRLFFLARGIRAREAQEGKPWTIERLHEVFSTWYAANPHLREGQTREAYMLEFVSAHDDVKVPLGAEGVLDAAWAAARTVPPPPEAAKYGETLGALAAWCREMQRIKGPRPFYLSARTVQTRLGLSVPMLAWNRLRFLVRLGILAEEEKGDRHRASSFRYLLPL